MRKTIFALLLSSLLLTSSVVMAQGMPFDNCPFQAYLFQRTPTVVYGLNLVTGAYATLQEDTGIPGNINAVGFNEEDRYLYGFNQKSRKISKLDKDYKAVDLEVSGLPRNVGFYVGDVHDNTYYVYRQGTGLFRIDLGTTPYVAERVNGADAGMKLTDLAFHPEDGLIYAVDNKSGMLYRVNPTDGKRVNIGKSGVTGTFGAGYFEVSGFYYISRNQDGQIFRLDLRDPDNIDPQAVLFASGPKSNQNDGARCKSAPIVDPENFPDLDFGDAPISYGTLFSDSGPRHGQDGNTLYLGAALPDLELDGQLADDEIGADDEDGVIFTTLEAGITNIVAIISSGEGLLNAWMDWNVNGSFDDAGEQIFTDEPLTAGVNVKLIDVPEGVTPNAKSWSRFRLSPTEVSGVGYLGGVQGGEVEDHAVTFSESNSSVLNYGPFTAAFEDQWPSTGDFDLNDAVVSYRAQLLINEEKRVRRLSLSGRVQAVGAGYRSGIAIRLEGIKSEWVEEEFVRFVRRGATPASGPLESGHSEDLVLVITENARADAQSSCEFYRTEEGCQEDDLFDFEIVIPFKAGQEPELTAFPSAPYDPFIFASPGGFSRGELVGEVGRGFEIHATDHAPTELGTETSQFFNMGDDNSNVAAGSLYRDSNGLPWGLIIADDWLHPLERVDILRAYPKLSSFITSGGASDQDWYTPAKRVSEYLYGSE